MSKKLKYTIFETKWGYFGLAGTDNTIYYTHLPTELTRKIKADLLKKYPSIIYQKDYLSKTQKLITAYFKGCYVNFDTSVRIQLPDISSFAILILTACRKVTFGQTRTYSQLAKKAGFPKAVRAAGAALAKNPIPLIIPCHRIIRSNGQIGGFSATGGSRMKKRLLQSEGKIFQSNAQVLK